MYLSPKGYVNLFWLGNKAADESDSVFPMTSFFWRQWAFKNTKALAWGKRGLGARRFDAKRRVSEEATSAAKCSEKSHFFFGHCRTSPWDFSTRWKINSFAALRAARVPHGNANLEYKNNAALSRLSPHAALLRHREEVWHQVVEGNFSVFWWIYISNNFRLIYNFAGQVRRNILADSRYAHFEWNYMDITSLTWMIQHTIA